VASLGLMVDGIICAHIYTSNATTVPSRALQCGEMHGQKAANLRRCPSLKMSNKVVKAGRMFTFRAFITFVVMAFIMALAVLLIFIQFWTFHLAARETAAAQMDVASAKTLGRLQNEIFKIASLVRVLSTSSSVADSDQGFEAGNAAVQDRTPRSAAIRRHRRRL
jgi:hypothetical protein